MTATVAPRLDSLTGMRFLAALLVFVHHTFAPSITGRGVARIPALQPFAEVGLVGVTFFFVLSGFVLAWSWQDDRGRIGFYGRRFARVYPLHALCWALALLVYLPLTARPRGTVAENAAGLTLTHAWVPDPHWYFAGNAPSWSLSCEAFFYALLPFLIPMVRRAGRRAAVVTVVACFAYLLVVPLVVQTLTDGTYAALSLWVSPPYRVAEFLIGVVLGWAIRSGWRPRWTAGQALALLLLAYSVAAFGLSDLFTSDVRSERPLGSLYADALVVIPVGALIAAVAARDLTGRRSWLGSRLGIELGSASYAFYLVHVMVVLVVLELVPGLLTPARGLVAVAVLGLLSLGAALVLHHLVERPAERWIRQRLAARESLLRPVESA